MHPVSLGLVPVFLAILLNNKCPCTTFTILTDNCFRNAGISLEKGWLYFLFFSRISRENATCTYWFLKSSLTRGVWGHTDNMDRL